MDQKLSAHLHALEDAEREPLRWESGVGSRLCLADGSPPRFDARRMQRRLESYWSGLGHARQQQIERLTAGLPPMSPECRMAVLVPARHEERNIGHTLELLLNQVDGAGELLSCLEIIILNNTPSHQDFDDTRDVVAKVSASHRADGRVHILDLCLPRGLGNPVALAAQTLADVAVHRVLSRGPALLPFVLACIDADLVWIDPRHLWHHLVWLERHPHLDAACPRNAYTPWILAHNDLTLFSELSWQLVEFHFALAPLRPELNARYDFSWNRVRTAGSNTMITLESYAMITGYSHVFGHDLSLGERLSVLRGSWRGDRFVPQTWTVGRTALRVHTSPRRWLIMAGTGIGPYDAQGEGFYSPEALAAIRTQDPDALLRLAESTSRINRDNLHRFEAVLDERLRLMLKVRKDPASARKQFETTMSWLGLEPHSDYVVGEGQVKLAGITRLARILGTVRARTLSDPRMPCLGPHAPGRNSERTWHSARSSASTNT
ncbi:glycosyltransferase family A protein [Nonomuraea sp. NPDC050547]|uniref:glycosyltransferase family A protein n=1 Tax=Nonomuraea sp. NPDC050547 TaxID=3364368 RepID=UPI0037ACC7FB